MLFLRWLKGRRTRMEGKLPLPAAQQDPGYDLTDLNSRLGWFQSQLSHCFDAIFDELLLPGNIRCALIYISGLINENQLQEHILMPLQTKASGLSAAGWLKEISQTKLIPVSRVETTGNWQQALQSLFDGTIVILIGNEPEAVMIPLKSTDKRSIEAAQDENVIRGPKEAFIEDLATNITMVRRRIKHPALKLEQWNIGVYSNTSVVICYMEGICEKKLVDEVKERLRRIDTDAIFDGGYIEEFIEDHPFSPFPQVQYTERPDTFSAALLEGRVGIMVDGSPMPIIVPVTLFMLLQSAEDYYQRFIAATWIRWIRYLFLLISFLMPSVYIAVTTFHPEMLPPNLLLTVAAAREDVPFPAIVEAALMEITFEALREAGLRIPKPIGQTVSIIGALVIGQAAVQAGIVSAPMVIVVSVTGVASFIIPHFDLGLAFRLLRFPVMILAASFGLYGVIVSVILIYLHLVGLRSFGTPYLLPVAPISFKGWKDTLIRAPLWMMKQRPLLYGTKNPKRMTYQKRPQIPYDDEGD